MVHAAELNHVPLAQLIVVPVHQEQQLEQEVE